LEELEDILNFLTMCGNPNHAHVLHVKGGVQTELANCSILPGCT